MNFTKLLLIALLLAILFAGTACTPPEPKLQSGNQNQVTASPSEITCPQCGCRMPLYFD